MISVLQKQYLEIIWRRTVHQNPIYNSPSNIFGIYASFQSYFQKCDRSTRHKSRRYLGMNGLKRGGSSFSCKREYPGYPKLFTRRESLDPFIRSLEEKWTKREGALVPGLSAWPSWTTRGGVLGFPFPLGGLRALIGSDNQDKAHITTGGRLAIEMDDQTIWRGEQHGTATLKK